MEKTMPTMNAYTRGGSPRAVTLTLIFLIVLASAFTMFDLVAGISLHLPWMLGGLGLGLVLGLLGTVGLGTRRRSALLLAYVLVLVGVRSLDWNARKSFLRDLYSIRVGMTRSQVDATMGKYLKGTGWPANSVANPNGAGELVVRGAEVYRHRNAGWGKSDWGLVRFEADRVTAVEFDPD
jgi:hypothetical protein